MKKAFTLLIFLVSASAWAQVTSTIVGEVVDGGSEPLPGVVVTITSPSLQGDRTAVSRANGEFLFRLIPPGTYSLTATMPGMKTSKSEIRVGLGQTARPRVVMTPDTTEETLVVTATSDPVLSTTAVTSHFNTEFVEKIAGSRDQGAVANLAPGTSNSSFGGQVSISGAPTHANTYLVNGVDSRFDNLRGGPANLVIEDAIQETTIFTSSISAEYGNFGGGVINSITKSGGNEFSGSFRTAFTNSDWTNRTPFEKEAEIVRVDKTNKAYTGTFGGPIIKDRLWFFGAYYTRENSFSDEFVTPEALSDSVAAAYGLSPQTAPAVRSIDGRGTENERYELKLTARIGENHEVVGSYQQRDLSDIQNGSSALDETGLWPSRQIPITGYSLNYRGTINESWTVDLLYSDRESVFDARPTGHINGDFREVGVLLRDQESRGVFGYQPPGSDVSYGSSRFLGKPDEPRTNETLRAKVHYFWVTDTGGSHDIVGGFEDFTDGRYADNRQSLNDWQFWSDVRYEGNTVIPIYTNTSDEGRYQTRLIYYPIEVPSLTSDLNAKSFFFNDSWTYNDNWAFNLGIRYEDRIGKAQDGTKAVDDSSFSPRLSANYDIFGDGRHGVSLSYSRYVQRIGNGADNISDAGSPTFAWLNYGVEAGDGSLEYTEDPRDIIAWMNNRYGEGFYYDPLNHPGRAQWEADLNTNSLYDPNGANTVVGRITPDGVVWDSLDSPYTDEYRLGWQWRLDRGFFKADFVARDFGNFYIDFINGDTGRTANGAGDLQVITNDDEGYERSYYAVQFQGAYRLRDNLRLAGNYTWSQLYGNIDGETASGVSDTTGTTTQYPEYNTFAQRNPTGYLPNDQRHKARIFLTYELSTSFGEFTFAGTQRYETGTPYSKTISLSLTGGRDDDYGFIPRSTSGYASPPSATTYYVGGRTAGRGEDMTQTDLGVTWELPISKARVFVEIDIFNLFDQNAAPYGWFYNTTVIRGDTFNVNTETPVEGTHYTLGSNYGKPNSLNAYQTPFSYRFDIGVRF